jgi:hypothetical protein
MNGGKAAMPEDEAPPYAFSKCANLEGISRRRSDISDEKSERFALVAYVGVEPGKRAIELSRGSGRLQRRILNLLEQSPERKRNREELDEMLVQVEGHDPSNVLRAIKGLARKHRVGFADRPHKKDSVVSLPHEVRRITEEELFELLAKTGGGR